VDASLAKPYLDSQKKVGNIQQRVTNERKVPHGFIGKPSHQLQPDPSAEQEARVRREALAARWRER
jgi:hypothetical protein